MSTYMIDRGLIFVKTNYQTGITAVLGDAQIGLVDAVAHATLENYKVRRVYTVRVRDEVTGAQRIVEGDKFALLDGDWLQIKPFNVLDDPAPTRPAGAVLH